MYRAGLTGKQVRADAGLRVLMPCEFVFKRCQVVGCVGMPAGAQEHAYCQRLSAEGEGFELIHGFHSLLMIDGARSRVTC